MEDKAPLENQTPTLDKDAEIKALKEELAAFKKEYQEKKLNESNNQKIEEIVASRIEEHATNERQRIEEARRMIEEADRNAALEQEFFQNERYNKLTSWRENKFKEFERELLILKDMGEKSEHKMSLYQNYNRYLMDSKHDERAKKMLGRIDMTYAAMNLSPEQIIKIFKRNIGVQE